MSSMILVQSHLQQLSGNKFKTSFLGFLIIMVLFTSCDLFKPVQKNNKNDTEELGEIGSDKPITNPNSGNDNGEDVVNGSNNGTDSGDPKDLGSTGNSGNSGEVIDTPVIPIDTVIAPSGYKGSYKIGILMPFYATDVSIASSVPPSAVSGLNFYEGALMALQQLSAEGINLDVEVFDTRRSSAIIQGLVDNSTLLTMDLLLGPVNSNNIRTVSEEVTKKGIPTVSLNKIRILTS